MNPLSMEERTAATTRHKDSLPLGEVWGLLRDSQKRRVLEDVLIEVKDGRAVENAINGGKQVWTDIEYLELHVYGAEDYFYRLRDEFIDRGIDGSFAACVNGVPGFENATRDIMWEMVSEGEVVEADGVSIYGGQP